MNEQLFTDGKAYEELMGRWSRVAGAAFLDRLDVPEAMRWLDAGCGNGGLDPDLFVCAGRGERDRSVGGATRLCAEPAGDENRGI